MTAVRIAALLISLATPILSGQTTRQAILKVQVEDQSGARVPGATVQVRAGERRMAEVLADAGGETTLSVAPGEYTVFIRARGFMSYSQVVDLASHTEQAVKAVLRVGQYSGPEVRADKILEPEPPVLDDVSIFSVPLDTVSVPAHKLRLPRYRPPTA